MVRWNVSQNDKLIELGNLSKPEAVRKLKQLVSMNIYYLNNSFLMNEINRRINVWQN